MTSPRAAVLLVAAALVGACTLADEPAAETHNTTPATTPSGADPAELRAELEWLLSPTRRCPPPSHRDTSSIEALIGAQLEILGSDSAPRCPEGDRRP